MNKMCFKWILVFLLLFSLQPLWSQQIASVMNLNGKWEFGFNRKYTGEATVPGLVADPAKITSDTVWYRKKIQLPPGKWTHASIELKGARFCPSVYINGKHLFSAPGGMAPVYQPLEGANIKPGQVIEMEIALLPLSKVKEDDASKIPGADTWRSNVSSLLWDDVQLFLHGSSSLKELLVFSDPDEDMAIIKYALAQSGTGQTKKKLLVQFADQLGRIIVERRFFIQQTEGELRVPLQFQLKRWWPHEPNLYQVRILLKEEGEIVDSRQQTFGHRSFKRRELQFELNGSPIKLRAATVVWHRWVRDPEAKELAWNLEWFEKNIVKRLKDLGANTLRFHLGMPPEKYLDLCDKYGLMVQAEWSFFHGMRASRESLLQQWNNWFRLSVRHPSTVLMHGWNETEGRQELETAFSAVNEVAASFPSVVIGHRDVLHIHKYWWSLFENTGLFYDSYKQFPLPAMVDEFGGNYLDGAANPGAYPSVVPSFLRFLGRNNTAAERLHHHTLSNVKIAEYWRRIGVAGLSPFCALGSREDGNHWFMGPLKEANPKPVWDALAVAYSPLGVSMELWDRNMLPAQVIKVPVHFFNDESKEQVLSAVVQITDTQSRSVFFRQKISRKMTPFSICADTLSITLPSVPGTWNISATLQNKVAGVMHPVVSEWVFHTMVPKVPRQLLSIKVGVDSAERELIQLLENLHIPHAGINDPGVLLIVGGAYTCTRMQDDANFLENLEKCMDKGKSVVLLNAGPVYLGQGYSTEGLGPLQSVRYISKRETKKIVLPYGVIAAFHEIAEPESHLQYAMNNNSLWEHLKKEQTWLWNGYRGGLIVPATEMVLTGLSAQAFLLRWKNKGAKTDLIEKGNYYACELQGFYKFSINKPDTGLMNQLKAEVNFLVEDAPALQLRINPNAPIIVHNLHETYKNSFSGKAEDLVALASAGTDLTKNPVVMISFGKEKGKLIISQLLTAKRLAKEFEEPGFYGIRYDPAAVQFVLNMMHKAITP